MFAKHLEHSSVVALISEETSEDGQSHKLLLRINDMRRWSKMVVTLLKATEEADEPSFGVSIRKEYYLNEEKTPTFCWVVFFWGEIADAVEGCASLLAKSFEPPPPPVGTVMAAPVAARRHVIPLERKRVWGEDGTERETTIVPLGGHVAKRNAKGVSRRRAFVEELHSEKDSASVQEQI